MCGKGEDAKRYVSQAKQGRSPKF